MVTEYSLGYKKNRFNVINSNNGEVFFTEVFFLLGVFKVNKSFGQIHTIYVYFYFSNIVIVYTYTYAFIFTYIYT